MKKHTLLPLLLGIFVANYSVAEGESDEYEYMVTPESTQIADLVDDDRDGVVNARDLCVGTAEGSLIDNDGCGFVIETEDELQLRILFANDSSRIEPLFENQIRNMSDFLKRFPETSIEVQGYASKVGAPEYNLALSKKRAIAVEQELVSNGLSPSRVTIVGYGESNLESDGDDELSHAKNRKVTATVVGFDEEVAKEWSIFSVIEK
ncbi:OmpA family protein [Vibrio sp. 404]|uniref:OmpA family protein n=1 Tax=Vibrio marinisediminis TaxID=2758441 RepID=A0A7W2ISQ1_9VIBR|nr:OmpA family protein [Vibrio marinisediminis]MBA5761559.1 OmpA family protein [Vibrio marinisediminis]